jgi:hypothetical protein
MSPLALALSPFLGRSLALAAALASVLFLPSLLLPAGPRPYLVVASVCLPAGYLLLMAYRNRPIFLLAARTRPFLTAWGRRVVLRYAPELDGRADIDEVLDLAERTLSQLEGRLGRLSLSWHRLGLGPLLARGRVCVYLFPSSMSIWAAVGVCGLAGAALNAVVVPFEDMPLVELLRHEMTHLFADRWNAGAPPLLSEGLATWMQGTVYGDVIDEAAAGPLGGGRRLRPLIDGKFFFDEENTWPCYVLAGSFSGFLIGRFGWDAYRRLYRGVAGARKFDLKLKEHLGLTLDEAEMLWREELLRRYDTLGKLWLAGLEGHHG